METPSRPVLPAAQDWNSVDSPVSIPGRKAGVFEAPDSKAAERVLPAGASKVAAPEPESRAWGPERQQAAESPAWAPEREPLA